MVDEGIWARLRRARPRPPPPGTGWAAIVVVVSVVLFIGLLLWYVATPGGAVIRRPTDIETVHQLARAWKERWPQVPGPPSVYADQATKAVLGGQPQRAAERLEMALSLAPDDTGLLLRLAALSARDPEAGALTLEQAREIVEAVARVAPDTRALPGARAWLRLAEADPEGALVLLDAAGPPDTLDAAWARMQALQELDRDAAEAARKVLEFAPAHVPACLLLARRHHAGGRMFAAWATVKRCQAAGAADPRLWRLLGEVADALGRFAQAAEAYGRAGRWLRAAEIIVQEDLPDPDHVVERALGQRDIGIPGAELDRIWIGLMRGDSAVAEASARALAERVGPRGGTPEERLALAAVRLDDGDARGALARLAGLDQPQARVLEARAQALLDEPDAMRAALDAAVAEAPWNRWVQRERVALLAARDIDAARQALWAAAGVDPLERALYREARWREAPWPAIAPDAWPALGHAAAVVARGLDGDPSVLDDLSALFDDPTWGRAAALVTLGLAPLSPQGRAAAGRLEDYPPLRLAALRQAAGGRVAGAAAGSVPPEGDAPADRLARAAWLARAGQEAEALRELDALLARWPKAVLARQLRYAIEARSASEDGRRGSVSSWSLSAPP